MKHFKFTVIGRGLFPLIMLYNDGCYPVPGIVKGGKTESIENVGLTIHDSHTYDEVREVKLIKPVTNMEDKPDLGKWLANGWSILYSQYYKE